MEISAIDQNFRIETKIERPDIRFYNAQSAPFRIYGLFHEDGRFRRLPEAVAREVNEKVLALHVCTAGGRVRFMTDSPYIAIHAKMREIRKMSHFAVSGSAGFDLYLDNQYAKTFIPPFSVTDGYESVVDLPSSVMREVTVHFPLSSGVDELYIGIRQGARLEEAPSYAVETPIVYYGSSITQGGCASRPGNAYQAHIARALNADFVNLGFSGSARGERAIAEYISTLTMSAFVYDYDHNAPTVEELSRTHEKMFRVIREANPTLPILMLSRPKFRYTDEELDRLAVIRRTYDNAIARGDENVYFIDGRELMAFCGGEGTVDNCHPNDLGFYSMAKTLLPYLQKIL